MQSFIDHNEAKSMSWPAADYCVALLAQTNQTLDQVILDLLPSLPVRRWQHLL
jgi:hypothetical protein